MRTGVKKKAVDTSSRSGFTLIELLVVVSIIATLISILMPSLASARQQAKGVQCLANLRRIAIAGLGYVSDNGVFPPFRLKQATGTTYVNTYGRSKPRWQWFFDQGVGPVIDPGPYGGATFGDSQTTTMTNKYFNCPNLRGKFARDIRNGAYGYNYQYLGNSRSTGNGFENFPVQEAQIRHASKTVLVADSRGGELGHGKHSYTLDPPRLATEAGSTGYGPNASKAGESLGHSPAEARHLDRANVAFIDGHAEPRTLTQLGYHLQNPGADQEIVVPNGPNATNRLWSGRGNDLVP